MKVVFEKGTEQEDGKFLVRTVTPKIILEVMVLKNNYKIKGDITEIYLKRRNGEVITTIISTSDLDKLKSYPNTWYPHWNEHTKSYYVYGNILGTNKKIRLHRFLLGVSEEFEVDHINHNTLDNTRENLRIVTKDQNLQNKRKLYKNNKSGVKGVTWNKQAKKWKAYITVNKKQIHLGYFDSLEEAKNKVIKERENKIPYAK